MNIYIYTLSHPISKEVKYVGMTNSPVGRAAQHYSHLKRNTPKTAWIKSLKKQGLRPLLEVVEETTKDNWQEDEIFWMAMFRSWGFNLTNSIEGGQGFGAWTEEMKLAKSKAMKGTVHTKDHREKHSKALVESHKAGKFKSKNKPVYSFNEDGSRGLSFSSLTEAAKYYGGTKQNVARAIKTNTSAFGLKWSFEDLLNMSSFKAGIKRTVSSFSAEGSLIETYSSVTEAAKIHSINKHSLSGAICRGNKFIGFLWKYADT